MEIPCQVILDSTNYFQWWSYIVDLLRSKDLYRIALGQETKPKDEDKPMKWENIQDRACGLIGTSISPTLRFHIAELDSFGSLSSLKYFDPSSCSNLRISSKTFGNIITLEHIDLFGCKTVEVWPSQLGHQRSLKVLKLRGTNFKKELPSVIELPSDLEVLWIGNPLLDMVMPLLGDLRKLKELWVEYDRELKCLLARLELSSQLSWLKVVCCLIIHTSKLFYDNILYPNLEKLILEECIHLVEIGTLPRTLTEVYLFRCDNLRSIEGLLGIPRLREVSIKSSYELQVPSSVAEMLK